MVTSPVIAIDVRMVAAIPHGIARYVTQLAKGLALQKQKALLPYRPLFITSHETDRSLFSPFDTVQATAPFLGPKEIFEIPKLLKLVDAALYHSPSFSSLWNSPCPTVVTIHDLNHLQYGSWNKKFYYHGLLKRFARQSRQVITVSEFSRQEIAAWLGTPPDRIEVVYNALGNTLGEEALSEPSEAQIQEVLSQFKLKKGEYFYSLSNPKPHKNLPFLCHAYAQWKTQQKRAWPSVLSISEDHPMPGVVCTGSTSNIASSVLLRCSSAAFFPSLYEGFGLPPVEAALTGTSLVVSQIPPHQEGLVDLAPHEVLWLPPTDLHGWTNAFHRAFRGELSPPSKTSQSKILERFSTLKMGVHMDQIYRRMIEPLK